MIVYKIVSAQDWHAAKVNGVYIGSPDDSRDGFIHLSAAEQVAETLAKHFTDRDNLLLIGFEASQLGAALRWEPSRGGELFPHVYGKLPTSLAIREQPIPVAQDGYHQWLEDIA